MKSSFDQINFTRNAELIENTHIYSRPILNLILAALLETSFLSSEHDAPLLNNEHVVKLAKGRIPEDVIVRVIDLYESNFDTSRTGVATLRSKGISHCGIRAMLSKKLRELRIRLTHQQPSSGMSRQKQKSQQIMIRESM